MSEHTDTSTSLRMVLMCVLFFVLGIRATSIASIVARRFQSDSSGEDDEDDVADLGPPLPPPDSVRLFTAPELENPYIDTRTPEQIMNDEASDEAEEGYREIIRNTTTTAIESGRPTPSATAKPHGAAAVSRPESASVCVSTYDKSTQVEDYAWWSNLKLEEEIPFRLFNFVSPSPSCERTV